ncbi:hypothetical protein CKO35_15690 [Ectothiorhodospira shaposhnikovii]|nr:hypothetical protein [Ectothiorhodospira shaposhnikovii]
MALGNVEYVPGFEPIPRALFDDIKERENTWIRERDNAGRYARENAEVVWERAGALPLETLNEGVDEPPEDAQIVELRSFYPELHMLQDGALYEWFNWYQMDCCYMGSWTPERDNGFLFYLLGKVAIKGSEEPRPEDVGECVAYALLHGYTWDEALDFGRATASYDGAIRSRAQNVATAMRFLKEDRVSEGSRGQPIRTMFDLFREGRKYNCHRYSLTLSEG